MQEDEAFKKRSALPLLIIGCFFWSITQTRSPKPFDTCLLYTSEHYTEFLKKLRQVYPKASVVCCTTLLEHDSSWDKAIDDVVVSMGDSKISHCIFKRNGAATPGHLRIPETYEMARELADYIENLGIEEWK